MLRAATLPAFVRMRLRRLRRPRRILTLTSRGVLCRRRRSAPPPVETQFSQFESFGVICDRRREDLWRPLSARALTAPVNNAKGKSDSSKLCWRCSFCTYSLSPVNLGWGTHSSAQRLPARSTVGRHFYLCWAPSTKYSPLLIRLRFSILPYSLFLSSTRCKENYPESRRLVCCTNLVKKADPDSDVSISVLFGGSVFPGCLIIGFPILLFCNKMIKKKMHQFSGS